MGVSLGLILGWVSYDATTHWLRAEVEPAGAATSLSEAASESSGADHGAKAHAAGHAAGVVEHPAGHAAPGTAELVPQGQQPWLVPMLAGVAGLFVVAIVVGVPLGRRPQPQPPEPTPAASHH